MSVKTWVNFCAIMIRIVRDLFEGVVQAAIMVVLRSASVLWDVLL